MPGTSSDEGDMISVGAPIIDIVAAEPLDQRLARITWETGETRIYDLAPAFANLRVFKRLRTDDKLFRTLKVNEDGNAIEWDDGAELSAIWIERLPPVGFENADFTSAMDDLGMSLDGMAAALEISRRQVASYRKDKPIPRHIELATRYLLEHRRRA